MLNSPMLQTNRYIFGKSTLLSKYTCLFLIWLPFVFIRLFVILIILAFYTHTLPLTTISVITVTVESTAVRRLISFIALIAGLIF